jgi:hypothetical protein
MPVCQKDHRHDDIFVQLSDDQSGDGRHKCAGCAYEEGRRQGRLGIKKLLDFESLPDSQAGTVRHKSPYKAFELGYSHGKEDSKNT